MKMSDIIIDQIRACQKMMDEQNIPTENRMMYGHMELPRNWFKRLCDRMTGHKYYVSFEGSYFVVGFVDRRGLHTFVRDGKIT